MSFKKTISLLPFIIVAACSNPKHDDAVAVTDSIANSPIIEEAIQQAQPPTANIEVKVFPNSDELRNTFGYDVLMDGKIYIHQPNIPALSGNRGFATEEQAKRVGEFMADKIRKNIMPPSVSTEELDSLGVK